MTSEDDSSDETSIENGKQWFARRMWEELPEAKREELQKDA